jgi:hypothetical protein
MPARQVSVRELEESWKSLGAAGYIATSEMPPWEHICWGRNWESMPLDDGAFRKRSHGYCGVYRIVGLNDALLPATITRLSGEDLTGTLYIGNAGRLNNRLNQFRRSMRRENSHGAASLWFDSGILQERFPPEKLRVSIYFTDSGEIIRDVERDLIRAYLNSFGDTPPLNCSY